MKMDIGKCLKDYTVKELAEAIENDEISIAYCSSVSNDKIVNSSACFHHRSNCQNPCDI